MDRNVEAQTSATIADKPKNKKKKKSSATEKENVNPSNVEEEIICLSNDVDYRPQRKVDAPVLRQRISRAVKSELIDKIKNK